MSKGSFAVDTCSYEHGASLAMKSVPRAVATGFRPRDLRGGGGDPVATAPGTDPIFAHPITCASASL